MKKLTENELKEILEKHQKYLNGEEAGEKADFSYTDLSYVDLSYLNLTYANFSHANLEHTNFKCSNLHGASLSYASLEDTTLDFANLSSAKFVNSYSSHIDALGANFANADLYNAKLDNVEYSHTTTFLNLACPEEGSFVGFKKVRCDSGDCIAKLLILDDSKRSSATTRKCRASKVKVLGFYDYDKNELPLEKASSERDASFIYHKGETIEIEDFNENRWEECSTGIHFFLTFDEAKNY